MQCQNTLKSTLSVINLSITNVCQQKIYLFEAEHLLYPNSNLHPNKNEEQFLTNPCNVKIP